jgi:hypothetical protein
MRCVYCFVDDKILSGTSWSTVGWINDIFVDPEHVVELASKFRRRRVDGKGLEKEFAVDSLSLILMSQKSRNN